MLTLRPQRVTAQTGSSDQLSFDLLSLFNTAASNPHNFSRVELEQKPCDHHSRIVGIRSGHAVAAPPMSVMTSLPFQLIKLQVRGLAAPRHPLAPEMIPQRPTAWLG
jgi:hypothetical protein